MNAKLLIGLCVALVIVGASAFGWYFYSNSSDEASPVLATAGELRELKEMWKGEIEQQGGEKAYASFLAQVQSRSHINPHDQAHAFGEALYEVEGLEGLKACDPSFEFGCYHSFFGVAVHAEGIETLPKFDEACKDKYGDFNLPCQHGIGHGVLVYTDYDKLEEALDLCDTIATLPTGGCSSGVFMEYNFHTMDESTQGYLREATDNLYEPCDTLPERYRASCYFEQVQWWQNIFNNDFKKIGELCSVLKDEEASYLACYNGIGNYVAAHAEFEQETILALCAEMPDQETQGYCHEGASWLVKPGADGEARARSLCEVLEEPYRTQCLFKLQF